MDNALYQLWFAVRYIHVVSVGLLAGGAATLCVLCGGIRARAEGEAAVARLAAPLYEWTFWSLAGLTVVTGVSNLGLKGDGLMGPATTWGRALTMKLTAALVLLAVSLVRTDFVIRCAAGPMPASDRVRVVLGSLYGLTVAILLAALWLGLGLAHGRY